MKTIYPNCPYCDAEQAVQIEPDTIRRSIIVICDTEAGGCDQEYILDFKYELKTAKRKIGHGSSLDRGYRLIESVEGKSYGYRESKTHC